MKIPMNDNKYKYLNILKNRIKYIDTLNNIQKNWINGTSNTPSENAIENTKYFLTMLYKYINRQENIANLNIILGPIPNGGICIEIHVNNKENIYFIFKNDGSIELEYY